MRDRLWRHFPQPLHNLTPRFVPPHHSAWRGWDKKVLMDCIGPDDPSLSTDFLAGIAGIQRQNNLVCNRSSHLVYLRPRIKP